MKKSSKKMKKSVDKRANRVYNNQVVTEICDMNF